MSCEQEFYDAEGHELYDPEATSYTRTMAKGHLMRVGHKLTGYYVPTATNGISKLVRTCCDSREPQYRVES